MEQNEKNRVSDGIQESQVIQSAEEAADDPEKQTSGIGIGQQEAAGEDLPEEDTSSGAGYFTNRDRRSHILWTVAGFFLVYTGYNLCSGYIKGEEGSAIGFFLAGVGFVALGIFFAVKGLQGMSREEKEKRARIEAGEAVDEFPVAGGLLKMFSQNGQARQPEKRMSISQRARLAGAADDEAVEEEDPSTAGTTESKDASVSSPEKDS